MIIHYDYRVTDTTKGIHVGGCAHCGKIGGMVIHAAVLRLYDLLEFSTADALRCANCGGYSAKQTGLWRVGAAFGMLFSLALAVGIAYCGYRVFGAEPHGFQPVVLPALGAVLYGLAFFPLRRAHESWRRLRARNNLAPHPGR